jgi:hypothetical protein
MEQMEDRMAEWALLETKVPGTPPVGVIVVDEHRLRLRMRPDWRRAVPDQGSETLREFETYIPEMAEEAGIAQVLDWLETSPDPPIRIGARQKLWLKDPNTTLENLYHDRVLAPRTMAVDSEVNADGPRARRRALSSFKGFNQWQSYKLYCGVPLLVVLVVAVFLFRHAHIKQFSAPSEVQVTSQILSELPMAPSLTVELPNLDAPISLDRPLVHAHRPKVSVRRQFEIDELTTQAPSAAPSLTVISAKPPTIPFGTMPQLSMPMPLPSAPPYRAKHRRLRSFFSVLFHKAPRKEPPADRRDQHPSDNTQEFETRPSPACCTTLR